MSSVEEDAKRIDVLVIGGSGFVGSRLVQAAQAAGLCAAYTYARRPLELNAPAYPVNFLNGGTDIEDCLRASRPRAVVHCAVHYPNDPAIHQPVSLGSVERLTHTLRELDEATRLVYVSTNAVFSGWDGRAYRESDTPAERADRYRAYGLYRQLGEQAALTAWPAETIVARTAHVEGRDCAGQLHWRMAEIVDPLRAGQPVARFNDRTITPTRVDTLTAALLEMCQPGFAFRGLLHVAGTEAVTDYSYAQRIAARLGADPALVQPDRSLPPEETRPYNIALDTALAQRVLATRLETLDEMLAAVFPAHDMPLG
jgi:dTDP-4-dehydrorhamnose reductase